MVPPVSSEPLSSEFASLIVSPFEAYGDQARDLSKKSSREATTHHVAVAANAARWLHYRDGIVIAEPRLVPHDLCGELKKHRDLARRKRTFRSPGSWNRLDTAKIGRLLGMSRFCFQTEPTQWLDLPRFRGEMRAWDSG